MDPPPPPTQRRIPLAPRKRSTSVNTTSAPPRTVDTSTRIGRSASVDRPYTPSKRSFSVPRKSSQPDLPQGQHSTSPSTSSNSSSIPSGVTSTHSPSTTDGSALADPQQPDGIANDTLPPAGTGSVSNVADTPLSWRPFYLQKRVLGAFAALFLAIIIILETLLSRSNRSDGIAATSTGARYLSIYGAPIILTVESIIWNRVETQAKVIVPWIRLANGPAPAEQTILLDYTSMMRPWAVFRAWQNRDWLVAATSMTTIILKLLMILSTGLVTLTMEPMGSLYQTTGSAATVDRMRLVVLPATVQVMVALLVLSLLLVGYACFTVPREGFLPTSPNTIISQATLLAESEMVLQPLRGYGAADDVTIRDRMSGYEYLIDVGFQADKPEHPMLFSVVGEPREDLARDGDDPTRPPRHPTPLHPVFRIATYLFIIIIIVVIGVTLGISQRNDGLADYRNPGDYRFLWASVPALVFTLISLHLESMDIAARGLAPYVNMKRGAHFDASVNLDIIDRSLPFVVYNSIKTMNVAVLLFVVAAFIGSFLAMLSGTLFGEMAIPTSDTSMLRIRDAFVMSLASINSTTENGVALARLVLHGNLTYPPFTYEDLAFPSLALSSDAQVTDSDGSSPFLTNATVPAVRTKLTCKMYGPSDIVTNVTTGGYNLGGLGIINPLRIVIKGEECGLSRADEKTGNNLVLGLGPSPPSKAFFGASDAPITSGCSDAYFAWGNLVMGSANPATPIAALACNQSHELVDVATTFTGEGFFIDPTIAPRPDESTVRNTTKALAITADVSNATISISSEKAVLSSAFGTLTTSRYAIPVEDLGDNSRTQEVIRAIQFQHGVIQAQIVSASLRGPANSTDSILDSDDPFNLPATITIPDGRRRVVQDMVTTRLLQVFLGLILLFSIGAWALMPDTKILPRTPGSIANVAALIAESNLLSFLPQGAAWMSPNEIRRLFADVEGFRLGNAPVRRRIGERGRGSERYMIHVLRPGAWRGGVEVGLGLMARVHKGHKAFARGLKD